MKSGVAQALIKNGALAVQPRVCRLSRGWIVVRVLMAFFARVAQLVERRSDQSKVVGSSPVPSILNQGVGSQGGASVGMSHLRFYDADHCDREFFVPLSDDYSLGGHV